MNQIKELTRHKSFRWIVTIAWMTLIFCLSSIQNLELSGELSIYDFLLRKVAHMVEYFILFGLVLWSLKPSSISAKDLLLTLSITIAYAFSDEVHQHFVPTRDGKLIDVAIDSIGALLALGIIITWKKYQKHLTIPKK